MFLESEYIKEILKAIDILWDLKNESGEWIYSRKLLLESIKYLSNIMNPFLYIREKLEEENKKPKDFDMNKAFFIMFDEDRKVFDQKILKELGFQDTDEKIKEKIINYKTKLGIAVGEIIFHKKEIFRYTYSIIDTKEHIKKLGDRLKEFENLKMNHNFEKISEKRIDEQITRIKDSIICNEKMLKQDKELFEKTNQWIIDWQGKYKEIKRLIKLGLMTNND